MMEQLDADDQDLLAAMEEIVLSAARPPFKRRTCTVSCPTPTPCCAIATFLAVCVACLASLLIAGLSDAPAAGRPQPAPAPTPACAPVPCQMPPSDPYPLPPGPVSEFTYTKPAAFSFTLQPGDVFRLKFPAGAYAVFVTTGRQVALADKDTISWQNCPTGCGAAGYINGPCQPLPPGGRCLQQTLKPFELRISPTAAGSTYSIHSSAAGAYTVLVSVLQLDG
jgi:hypothetical protein